MIALSQEQIDAFRQQGFLVWENFLSAEEHQMLLSVCDHLLNEPVDDDLGGKAHNIGRGKDRRFLRHRHGDFADLSAFLLGPRMAKSIGPLVDNEPFLFNEQFVVKGPKTGASFAWHQDSGYVGFEHRPYLSLWLALDDTTLSNGALSVLPRDLETQNFIEDHVWDEAGKEYVGYRGDEEGVLVECLAGTAVLFSSLTLHRSGQNITDRNRRAFLAQFSAGPIFKPGTTEPKTFAKPLAA